ncbi:MAG: DEAD/DEAH box helicase [Fervidicoccaceae archaeon]
MAIQKVIDSKTSLERDGYTVITKVEPPAEPERIAATFSELYPELLNTSDEVTSSIASSKPYSHQLEAMDAISSGLNLIMISGTGSGKTEAWALPALKMSLQRKFFRTIAIYPTLALAEDQIKRISSYGKTFGIEVLRLDSPSREEIRKSEGKSGIRRRIAASRVLLTNPSYLMSELKKYMVERDKSILEPYFSNVNLIVIDEFDFYDPRSVSLLLGMMQLISDTAENRPQIAVLTATLANPEELGEYLKSITGRGYKIIIGKPFHVENRVHVVLGKNLRSIWEDIRKNKEVIIRKLKEQGITWTDDVSEALDNFEKFQESSYKVLSYIEALGFPTPSLIVDIAEILQRYLNDDGLTIVFTRSINRAEEIGRSLRMKLGEDARNISTHHHLVPKDVRKEIEDKARSGEMKIIISPRTLSQGIDIGRVVRIVHVGLPDSVREFKQREGRKGRRPGIPFTETIIIPFSSWDRELLSKGFDIFEKWSSLPLEKTIVNPKNLYQKLFTGLVKLKSTWYKPEELTELEIEALRRAKIIERDGSVNKKKLKYVWDRMNFYEYAPPYGIKRVLEEEKGTKMLEPIGFCDLVEIFQRGCFDYSNDAMVYRHRIVERGRGVTAVVEKRLKDVSFWEDESLARAAEEYMDTKHRWGEEPSIIKDIMHGFLTSKVIVTVYPPRNGFGLLVKIPDRVLWIASSAKHRIYVSNGKAVISRSKKAIEVPVEVHGKYTDFTYGYVYEVDERLDERLIRLGLALIVIALRRLESISLSLLEYGIETVGGKKFFDVHETASAGFIENFDWLSFKDKVEKYSPDDLDLILLNEIDELAYADFIELGFDWKAVREYSLKMLDYLNQGKTIEVIVSGEMARIPRPSRELKLVSLDALIEPIERGEEKPFLYLIAISYFDGEDAEAYVNITPIAPGLKPDDAIRRFETELEEMMSYEEFQLLVSSEEISKTLLSMGLRRLPEDVERKGIEVMKLIEKRLSPPSIEPYLSLARNLYNIEEKDSSIEKILEIVQKIRREGYTKLMESEARTISSYMKLRSIAIYLAYIHSSAAWKSSESTEEWKSKVDEQNKDGRNQ